MHKLILLPSLLFSIQLFGATPLELSRTFVSHLVDLEKLAKQKESSQEKIQELLNEATQFIDVSALAKKSLGTNFSKVTSQQFRSFETLLKKLIEKNAYPQVKKISAHAKDLQYAEKKNDLIRVSGRLEREKFGDIIENDFEMELYFSKNSKIVDAKVEGELLSENFHRQINKALEKKTFQDVLNAMSRKVKQVSK